MVTSTTQYDQFLTSDDDFDLTTDTRLAGPRRGNRELSGQAKRQRAARFGRKSNAPSMSQTGLHRRRFRKGGAL